MKRVRIILHGSKREDARVQEAIRRVQEQGLRVETRLTQAAGDAARFAEEALADEIQILIAGGGDGTLHEIVNGVLSAETSPEMAIAVLPLGTANDFAGACDLSMEPYEALRLATTREPTAIDVVAANDVFFVNVASCGFGAEVTAETPQGLKELLGGGAYAVTGLLKAIQMTPYEGRLEIADHSMETSFIALAFGNGRLAGGGLPVAPRARLDDGLLDLLYITAFEAAEVGTVVEELRRPNGSENRFVHYRQAARCRIQFSKEIPINLDGEPYSWSHVDFETRPGCLPVVLPDDCSLLGS